LSKDAISRKTPRAKRGAGGLTKHGSKVIRSACVLLEKEVSKERLSFLTVTAPTSKQSELKLIAERSSELMKAFREELGRELRRKGLSGEIIDVAEFQARGALHWHMTFEGRKRGKTWGLSCNKIDSIWHRCLSRIGLVVDSVKAACNIQRVEKSLVGYLAKYLTKGAKALASFKEEEKEVIHPSSWYGCSTSLRQRVEAERVSIRGLIQQNAGFWESIAGRIGSLRGVLFWGLKTFDDGVVVALYGRSIPGELKNVIYEFLAL
jgi:hypothetical protein